MEKNERKKCFVNISEYHQQTMRLQCAYTGAGFIKNPYLAHMEFENVKKNEVKSSCVPWVCTTVKVISQKNPISNFMHA